MTEPKATHSAEQTIAARIEVGSLIVGMDFQVLASEVRDGVRVITEVKVLGASLVRADD